LGQKWGADDTSRDFEARRFGLNPGERFFLT
jgi:hypothetical protein